MKTLTASPEYCAVRRARMDRVLSGLGALALIGTARRFDGWGAIGLAAFGGVMIGRAMTGHRIGRAIMQSSRPSRSARSMDPVQQAGEDSFPASDPPSWSPTSAGAPHTMET